MLREWVKARPTIKNMLRLPGNMAAPLASFGLLRGLAAYPGFFIDFLRFRRMGGRPDFLGLRPMLAEKTSTHSFDHHYFYQAVWAMKKIVASGVAEHYDVGSQSIVVGMLTAVTRVHFIDIRPLGIELENYDELYGSVLDLPMADSSVVSLSCMHVLEHVGLGRYGDPLDPEGHVKAARELSRVLAPGGNLYLSAPVGRPRIEFNAHRIQTVQQIVDLFDGLKLVDISIVDDRKQFHMGATEEVYRDQEYALGMFAFTKINSSEKVTRIQ